MPIALDDVKGRYTSSLNGFLFWWCWVIKSQVTELQATMEEPKTRNRQVMAWPDPVKSQYCRMKHRDDMTLSNWLVVLNVHFYRLINIFRFGFQDWPYFRSNFLGGGKVEGSDLAELFQFTWRHQACSSETSVSTNKTTRLSLLLHRASCRFTNHHTTNKCTNCMSFILNHFFKTLFTAPACFDSISLIIIREHI